MTADIATFDRWKEQSRRDDWHTTFVGSDIRQMLGEIERLRTALQTIVGMCLAPDQKGHGIGKMHAIACRALEGEHAISRTRSI